MKYLCITILLCLLGGPAAGRKPKPAKAHPASDKSAQIHVDSTQYEYPSDTVKNRGFLGGLIINNIFRDPPPQEHLEENTYAFDPFKGKIIDSIVIFRYNVFDGTESDRLVDKVHRWANHLHRVTREKFIREELLFKPGDRLDPAILSTSEYILRNKYFLSKAMIFPTYRNGDPLNDTVDIHVYTQDSWSLGVDVVYRKRKDSRVTIFDDNFLGWGNRLSLTNYFNVHDKKFSTGVELGYFYNNILGSFFNADFVIGTGRKKSVLGLNVFKDFNTSNDYGAGINYLDRKFLESQIGYKRDTDILVHYSLAEAWLGQAFRISPNETNIYVTGKAQRKRFSDRPEVTPDKNPYYFNQTMLLGAVGIYNEKFYKGNLIYGFGNIEDIPYGYKVELLGGRRWTEFDRDWYIGASLCGGNLFPFGYIGHCLTWGTYVKDGRKPMQSIYNWDFVYFSNLLALSRRFHLRQFLNIEYTGGFNMLGGQREMIRFEDPNYLRGLKEPELYGTTRLIVSPQSVLFTPLHVYGFRFAFFAYSDLGWLGYKNNPFRNDFYGTIGIGIRVRNERLIFRTIQLRLSFALNKSHDGKNRLINLAKEDRLRYTRFTPGEPSTVGYR